MRTEERLEDAKKLQNFLDELTPLEWKEGLVQARDDRHAAKLARWQAECDSITSSLMVSVHKQQLLNLAVRPRCPLDLELHNSFGWCKSLPGTS